VIAGLFFFRYSGFMKKHIALISTLLTLSACATLTAEREQDISITTTPAGARCLLTNGQESWTLDETPGVVSLPRAYQPITLNCNLAGYAPVSTVLEPKTRGRAYGNLLLGGVPAIVDASTGAGYAYEPESVVLEFK
jgi:hypothetical protein